MDVNQRRIWSDPSVVADRRGDAEEALGRAMEMEDKQYSDAEKATAAAHLERVKNGGPRLASVRKDAA